SKEKLPKGSENPPKGSEKPPKGSEKPPKGSKKPKEKPPKATKPSGKKPPVPPSPPTEPPTTLQPSQGKEDEETSEPHQPLTLSLSLEELPNERWGLGREDWNPEPQPEVPEELEPPTLDYNEQLEREDYEDFEYIRRQQKPPKSPSRRRPERVWPQPEETQPRPQPHPQLPPQPLPQPPLPGPVTEGDYGEGFEPPDYDDWTYGLPLPTKPHEHPDEEDGMETDEEKIRL
ncbi:AEBP1 protein, partial [Oxylabes madagascariensis]|nr:AEBP1 protein [Oxylabes madagascariensis]